VGETIFAVASGRGRAGVAVIRISGKAAGAALSRLTGRLPPPRRASCVRVRDGAGEVIDEALALWFPAPASFTGEDVAELHVHGGRAVIDGVLTALAALPGLRPAEPGEFSRRAFEHGKLDLTAAEGLADLVTAETAAQRRQAVRQLQGELGRLYDGWRRQLVEALAYLEATIDFADEELPAGLQAAVAARVDSVARAVARHLDDGGVGERIRDGIEVAIVGAPNAGKSSLLNALVRREAAIVSPHPGTTRDIIEVAIDLAGYPVVLADTAGLRESADAVEAEGVRRAAARAAAADLRIAVIDASRWPEVDAATRALFGADTVVVLSKCDLAAVPADANVAGYPAVSVSALTGVGLDELISLITARVGARFAGGPAAAPALTRLRHRQALQDCALALSRSRQPDAAEEQAEHLRAAATALGRITGRIDVEAVLEVIFRDFCIGK
jgi:tRNA modification GTPase